MKTGKQIITIPRCLPPFLGIPCPGERPFVVEATRFAAIVRMSHIVAWEIDAPMADGRRVLRIVHHTKGVKGRIALYETLMGCEVRNRMRQWRESQFKRRNQPSAKPKRHEIVIARLTKELRKLYEHPPYNPLLKSKSKGLYEPEIPTRTCSNGHDPVQVTITGNVRHYIMSCVPGCAFNGYEHKAMELRWHDDKVVRKALAKVTAFYLANPNKKPEAYERLLAVARPKFKYAQRDKRHESWSPLDYWTRLPEVCGFEKPYSQRVYANDTSIVDQLKHHIEARREFANTIREASSLRSQIAEMQRLGENESKPVKAAAVKRHCTRFTA